MDVAQPTCLLTLVIYAQDSLFSVVVSARAHHQAKTAARIQAHQERREGTSPRPGSGASSASGSASKLPVQPAAAAAAAAAGAGAAPAAASAAGELPAWVIAIFNRKCLERASVLF
jgi:hypothetical protein